MQPLQPVSIKLVKSMLRIRFMNAFNVLADLSAVAILLFCLCEIFEEHFGCNWMVKPLRSQKSRIFTVYWCWKLKLIKKEEMLAHAQLWNFNSQFSSTCVKIVFYSLSPESLRTMVLMRKDVRYECVKRYVKKRKEDPYAFFTPSLRTRKFNFSCSASN